jgi:glycosyltransferase involved in cell wall biosynthesis
MNEKRRSYPKKKARKESNGSPELLRRPKAKDMGSKSLTRPTTGMKPSALTDIISALGDAHGKELERIHLQYAERIRQIESAHLEQEEKLEQQQEYYADLAEQHRKEAKDRTTELLAAKDLALQATGKAATIEQRIAQMELQRDVLETERKTLHETIQTLRKERDAQGKVPAQFQAQLEALEAERRALQETVHTLRKECDVQGKAPAQYQAQLEISEAERRTLQETIQTLRQEHEVHGKAATQHQAQLEALEAERRTLQETIQTLRQEHEVHGKAAMQYQAQLEALEAERRTLHETIRTLRKEREAQGKVPAQSQAQLEALEEERQALGEALQSLREQYEAQGKVISQLQTQRDLLATERRTLHETLQAMRGLPVQKGKPVSVGGRSVPESTRISSKPVIDTVPMKIAPVIELKTPEPVEAVAKPVALDPIPLPIGRNSMTAEEKTQFEEKLDYAIKTGGPSALEELVEKQTVGRPLKFTAFCQIKAAAVALANGQVAAAGRLAEAALKNDPVPGTLRMAARLYYNAALFDRANQLFTQFESGQETIQDADRRFINEARGQAQLVSWAAQPARPRSLPLIKGRVLNVLAFSLPYSSVGYATRSHGLALGIQHAGWDIRPYTRPCFPFDLKPELEGQPLPDQDEIDGITYRRQFDFDRKGLKEVEYLLAAVDCLTRVIEKEQPEVVHAASNYVTALPALIAARRLGVPFLYEMRGFWEVTHSSRDAAFEYTPKYRFMQLFEDLVAKHADHVITITTAMKEDLVARGVLSNKISIAYNSVDPKRFTPSAPNRVLAEKLGIPEGVPVIGYIGSFVDYEGLDDLIMAAAGLKQVGRDFRLLMVGDGAVFEALRAQVQSLALDDRVILTGRVPHEEVEDYYSLVDIAPFPRKPWKVCELVSPLKPFEAMALEKAVVVSGTRALMEIVDHEQTGLVFEKGSVESLQQVLDILICEPEKRAKMGKIAREWVIRERTWDVAGKTVTKCYRRISPRSDVMGKAS